MSSHAVLGAALVALTISISGAEECDKGLNDVIPGLMGSGTCTQDEIGEFARHGKSPSCKCGKAFAKGVEDYVASSGCDSWGAGWTTPQLLEMLQASCTGMVASSLSGMSGPILTKTVLAGAVPSSQPTFPSLILAATIGGLFGSLVTVLLVRRSDRHHPESLLG
mmetsp:Transcript_3554/g.6320  ORF Transcript_3554/g.6320 Transcript_3554/m.6320 type:complete len:165 (+) Transcript_3554:102-596(+)